MSDKPVSYARVRPRALQHLAATGDVEAVRELQRRGQTPAASALAAMDLDGLRNLVRAWRDGSTHEEREASFERAHAAQHEMECRYRALANFPEPGQAPAVPPSAPPWSVPLPPRCQPWQRPQGSKLYPGPDDETRAELQSMAHEHYAARSREES